VSSIVFFAGKGLGAQSTLYFGFVLATFVLLVADKMAFSAKGFLTALTMHAIRSAGDGELSSAVYSCFDKALSLFSCFRKLVTLKLIKLSFFN